MTHRCIKPHRVQASMHDGDQVRHYPLTVGENLRAKVIDRTNRGIVRLQPIGDPDTELRVAWILFAKHWEQCIDDAR